MVYPTLAEVDKAMLEKVRLAKALEAKRKIEKQLPIEGSLIERLLKQTEQAPVEKKTVIQSPYKHVIIRMDDYGMVRGVEVK